MKQIARILTIRRHKTVTFLDVYENLGIRKQVLCYNNFLQNISLSIGDIICFEGINTTNKKGIAIIELTSIYWINPVQKWLTPKGIDQKLSSSIEEIRLNARNAGKQIKLWKCQNEFVSIIKTLLISSNFLEFKCKSIEEKRTSAKRQPLSVNSIYSSQNLYLRITMENQLKQACSILLNSVFSIDNVFYDKSTTSNIDREVCILELISLEFDYNDLIQFIQKLDSLLRELFEKFDLKIFGYSLPSSLQILDYSNFDTSDFEYSQFENVILKNVPVNSPFIKSNENGKRTELQWIIRGKMLGHGYLDEFNYNSLLSAVISQKQKLNLNDCNMMDYMNYGIPRSISFGLGIDQLLYRFYNLENVISISNPLGIYFD